MKLKNVEVGQSVKVKSTNSTFEDCYVGVCGTVERVERLGYTGDLSVLVRFPHHVFDWGNHKDIKPVKP